MLSLAITGVQELGNGGNGVAVSTATDTLHIIQDGYQPPSSALSIAIQNAAATPGPYGGQLVFPVTITNSGGKSQNISWTVSDVTDANEYQGPTTGTNSIAAAFSLGPPPGTISTPRYCTCWASTTSG